MNQTLVIGSAVVDVIIEIPHLPVTQEDVHITKQTRSLGGCAYLASDILRHFTAHCFAVYRRQVTNVVRVKCGVPAGSLSNFSSIMCRAGQCAR